MSETDQEKEDPHTTLTQEELTKSFYRFEESIRLHEEKSLAAYEEEEEEVINFPTHFSDGDKLDEEMQTILDDVDPIDPRTMDDSVMAEKIHNLVKRTLNECSQQDSDQSNEEPITLENGNRPPTSRLPSVEPTTPIAKSTLRFKDPNGDLFIFRI